MQITQAKYGSYGVVVVLQNEGHLSQIQTDNDNTFWVRTEKLKPVKEKVKPATIAISDGPTAWGDFVVYLTTVGYKLYAYSRVDGIEQVQAEYLAWAGEEMDDNLIKLYDNKPVPREWVLSFTLSGHVVCPFPIEIMGTTGKRPTQKPRGLYRTSQRVEVNFAAIVEQLVRAGLRATA
jgi:hypothetical protein